MRQTAQRALRRHQTIALVQPVREPTHFELNVAGGLAD
jgi:hypothetical protein